MIQDINEFIRLANNNNHSNQLNPNNSNYQGNQNTKK